ncbi:endonuclease/exonuclease/phosphatase family protein [Nocardioides sp.]|uniref:endonuclease/exonuclease/phosphatase family protein n=1 Tax=Nocardioides sp. TaxID=35761 RepID=UPI0035646335
MTGKRAHRRQRPVDRLRPFFAAGIALLVVTAVIYEFANIRNGDRARDDGSSSSLAGTAAALNYSASQRVVSGVSLKRLPPKVCTPEVVTESLTVVGFNIKSRITNVADILAASGADIVLLQEVDKFRANSRYLDQAGYVGAQLEMANAFGANVLRGRNRFGTSQYGTAILSKYPIVSATNTHLPNARGGQQRGLLHVVVDVNGIELSIYNTHLQNKMEALRVRQMGAITPVLAADPNPLIIGGDFNATPRSRPLQMAFSVVSDPWASGVGVGSSLTHPSVRPRGRIDYLLHGGPGLEPTRADVLTRTPSDHRAVRTSYELTGEVGEVCSRPTT